MASSSQSNTARVNAGPVQKFKIICLITSLAISTEETTRVWTIPYGEGTLKGHNVLKGAISGQRGRTYLADASFLL
ncbi:hypothetical protein Tco_0294593 [Tanacetum coccineum]